MDDIVKQALAKWPNVPHCYGWLALDARGNWRMRNEAAQARNLAGDKLAHAALLGFINRNYNHDECGRWYFQNGPQRVYVNLEATPYIARTDPQQAWILHTGELMPAIVAVWLTETGALLLQAQDIVAQVDDRDLAHCMMHMEIAGQPASDEQLLQWLAQDAQDAPGMELQWRHAGTCHIVRHLAHDAVEGQFGFVRMPQAPAK